MLAKILFFVSNKNISFSNLSNYCIRWKCKQYCISNFQEKSLKYFLNLNISNFNIFVFEYPKRSETYLNCYGYKTRNLNSVQKNMEIYKSPAYHSECFQFFHSLTLKPLLNHIIHYNNYMLLNKRLLSTTSDSINVSSAKHDKLFKAPKNVLHNAYDIVAKHLENGEFKIQPSYNVIKSRGKNSSWCCTYHTKWPEQMKFVATGQTKQEASHKAATATLVWLRKNNKLTTDGFPVLVEMSELKEITTKSKPSLTLDDETSNCMKKIYELYKDKFIPALAESVQLKRKESLDSENVEDLDLVVGTVVRKKVFPRAKYFTKEKTSLPISEYKAEFMKLLSENRVLIIKGEPGCGKSTRIPQYVLESWAREDLPQGKECQIAVTQPRRIAAISLADRVADERDENCGHVVGYQIRLKSNYNPTTGRVLYCTTGILLKHLQHDVNLSNFTHIILDEVHERDVNTDLLLNLIKKALETNTELKLIVMSATVDVDLFKNYLDDPPVMHIPGFTYPVESYFLDDLKKLNLVDSIRMSENNEVPNVMHKDVVKTIEYIHKTKPEGAILCFLPGWEDITKIEKMIPKLNDLTVLCLHSRLQDSDQRKIFAKTPPGVRKIILSTNIAETSITIDDVVYVIDTGIHKEKRFDNEKGVNCIDNFWISQSSMAQRRGRAGRVQPGKSFHLYTNSKYDLFTKFTDPEIRKTSLTKIVLNSKVYSNNMDAIEFMSQLPTPPEKNATRRAVRELRNLKLLDENEKLTSLGKTLANFQLEPKLAKILVNSVIFKCVTPVVDIVTLFSADTEIFNNTLRFKEEIKKIKGQASTHSDHLAMMRLYEAWLELMEEKGEETAIDYTIDANLVHYKLITINKLRKIHFDYLYNNLHKSIPIADNYSDNDELVKGVLFSGSGNLLRYRDWDIVKGRYKKSKIFLNNFNQKATITSDSVNFKKSSFSSMFFVYFNEVRSNIRRTTVIRECSEISPIAVLLFSDKKLQTQDLEGETDKVLFSLKDTKTDLIFTKLDAQNLQKCKEAIDAGYEYFIYQMTEGAEYNDKLNTIWNEILANVNNILLKNSIK